MDGSRSQETATKYFWLAYCLFIIYGSFIPFRFNLDPNFLRWRWEELLIDVIHARLFRASLSDVVSNVLLFVPFGILCVWVRMAGKTTERALRQILLTVLYALLFGVAIEAGQTLSPWRSPSPRDVICNGTGALIGAIFGRTLFPAFKRSVEQRAFHSLQHQPALLILAYLLLGVILNSFYPFAVTLDVSTVWQNLKHSHFVPLNGAYRGDWLDLFEKATIFAAVGYVLSINLQHQRRTISAPVTWLLCSGLALVIEASKLFFVGRSFQLENVIIRSLGAFAGILLFRRLSVPAWAKRRGKTICFLLVAAVLAYFELSPFEWIAWSELASRLSRIEWLPFRAYYFAEPLAALFDLQQKIYFFLPLGFVVISLVPIQRATVPRRAALLVCIFIAAALESLQIFVRPRIPSTTDVIIFGASAWAGIVLFEVLQGARMETGQRSSHQAQTDAEGGSGIPL
jgi:VanZ family protein